MKTVFLSALVLVLAAGAVFTTERSDEDPMAGWAIPAVNWDSIPQPANNPITQEKVDLGAMLFFEPRLSASNTMSCATCHSPIRGYGDGLPLFEGDHGETGPRNSPQVNNLAWNTHFFWDGRAASLEEQALGPITSSAEMRQEMASLKEELRQAGYLPHFQRAFGDDADITEEHIAKAVATFERTLVSHDAPFDRYMAGDRDALKPSQIRGKQLFETKGRCIECHNGPNFTDSGFYNLGVDTVDVGRYAVLPLPSMKFAFKTPSLRDVEYSAPYLHNGSARTLREVVEFYNVGGHPDARQQPNLAIVPLGLTDQEIDDLTAFMYALSGIGARNIPVPPLP